jgi:hypothetical protein
MVLVSIFTPQEFVILATVSEVENVTLVHLDVYINRDVTLTKATMVNSEDFAVFG